jgi:hypothetical protein
MADFKTPQELLQAYIDGFTGVLYKPEHLEKFLGKLPQPLFSDAGKDIKGSGAGKLSLPYKAVIKLSTVMPPYLERQSTGDCVSHSTRNAVDVSRATQILFAKLAESFVIVGATEGIYGYRGHGGQGMSCSEAAEFVHEAGGVLLRQKYGDIDLSKYKASYGIGWGTKGVPKEIKEEAKKHQVKTVSRVRTVEEARDALANGYGLSVCSNWGFSSTRDKDGFAKPSGSWSHAMAWTACDDAGPRKSFMIQNSWGAWNGGGHPTWGPIPDGAFLIDYEVANKMLNAGGAFAFSAVEGFPAVDLLDWGTGGWV